jgi:hypothetical protein
MSHMKNKSSLSKVILSVKHSDVADVLIAVGAILFVSAGLTHPFAITNHKLVAGAVMMLVGFAEHARWHFYDGVSSQDDDAPPNRWAVTRCAVLWSAALILITML